MSIATELEQHNWIPLIHNLVGDYHLYNKQNKLSTLNYITNRIM